MKSRITGKSSTPNGGTEYFITVEVEEYFEKLVELDLVYDIKNELVKVIMADIKDVILEKVKSSLDQLVKDVGIDIMIAGLRHILGKKEKR